MAVPLTRPARGAALVLLLLVPALFCSCASGPRTRRLDGGPPHRPRPPRFSDAKIELRGNDTLWGFTLRGALADFEERVLTSAAVDDAAFTLERYYASRGFIFAGVAGRLGANDEGKPLVRFTIHEGPRPSIASITFVGGSRMGEARLRAATGTRVHHWYGPSYVDADGLRDDQDRLENLYVAAGYIDARVGYIVTFDEDLERAHLIWSIDEGEHYMLEAISVFGNAAFSSADLVRATGLRRGVDYYPRRVFEVRAAIQSYYRDHGYAFAKVDVAAEVDRERRAAVLRATVDEGRTWRFGKLTIRGNDVTARSIIAREARFEPGELFSQAKVRETERRLYDLGIFERVDTDVTPSATEPGRADVAVTVRERPAGAIRVGAGYGSWEQFRGAIQGSYDNLFGRGIRIDGRAIGSFRGFTLNAGYRDIHLFGTPLRLDIDAYYEDRDVKVFTIQREGGTGFLSYPLIERVRIAAGTRVEHSKVTDVSTGALVERDTENLVSAIAKISRDGRDDPIEPRWGSYHEVAFEKAGVFDLGSADFSRLTAGASYFASAPGGLTFALGLRGGVIFPQDGTEVPLQERFFLGGDSSLRGFGLNEVGDPNGGNVFVLGSLEVRKEVYGPLALAAFVDAGNVFDAPRDVDVTALRVTPGVGIRFRTPIGPLRLDIGFKADKKRDEDLTAVHFSVGYPF
jgi:outer membrane protein insertion porin family